MPWPHGRMAAWPRRARWSSLEPMRAASLLRQHPGHASGSALRAAPSLRCIASSAPGSIPIPEVRQPPINPHLGLTVLARIPALEPQSSPLHSRRLLSLPPSLHFLVTRIIFLVFLIARVQGDRQARKLELVYCNLRCLRIVAWIAVAVAA